MNQARCLDNVSNVAPGTLSPSVHHRWSQVNCAAPARRCGPCFWLRFRTGRRSRRWPSNTIHGRRWSRRAVFRDIWFDSLDIVRQPSDIRLGERRSFLLVFLLFGLFARSINELRQFVDALFLTFDLVCARASFVDEAHHPLQHASRHLQRRTIQVVGRADQLQHLHAYPPTTPDKFLPPVLGVIDDIRYDLSNTLPQVDSHELALLTLGIHTHGPRSDLQGRLHRGVIHPGQHLELNILPSTHNRFPIAIPHLDANLDGRRQRFFRCEAQIEQSTVILRAVLVSGERDDVVLGSDDEALFSLVEAELEIHKPS
mmetsp:Transcript_46018/g.122006  ORF Transcript_46018/g.122006 Transcript_46018/m.122006 type:complete len:314 (-) Transcript_46018:102-1043(-)